MPTSSIATPEQEGTVTVQVDMGDGQDEVVCTGEFSTLTLPGSGELDYDPIEVVPLISEPTIYDLIGRQIGTPNDPYNLSMASLTHAEFLQYVDYLEEAQLDPAILTVEGYEGLTEDARGSEILGIGLDYSLFQYGDDLNNDERLTIADANVGTWIASKRQDVRFDITFQASNCAESSDGSVLTATRTELQRTVPGQTGVVEISSWELLENTGYALLFDLDNLERNSFAYAPNQMGFVETSFADETAVKSLMSRIEVLGENPTGVFSTDFNFHLYVGTSAEFETMNEGAFRCYVNPNAQGCSG